MIRTGDQYRESIRDGRDVWMNGEKVTDVTTHPAFKPLVDIRARIYDMAHDPATRDSMTYEDESTGEVNAIQQKPPRTREDWDAKRAATDAVLSDVGGVVTRVGDETIGEVWSLIDGQDVLNAINPTYAENVKRHIDHALYADPFHVSANTDPKGDRSSAPRTRGPGHAPPRRAGDGQRHRRARRQVRDGRRLLEPGVHEADDRELGRLRTLRLRPRLHRRHGLAGPEVHLPHGLHAAASRPPTTRSPAASTRSTPWSSSTTSRSPGRTSSSTGTPRPRPSSAPRSTATARSRSRSATCGSRT